MTATNTDTPKDIAVPEQPSTLIDRTMYDKVAQLDEKLRAGHRELREAEEQGNDGLKMMLQAAMIQQVRDEIAEMIPLVRQLMGTPLGFITDRDAGRRFNKKTKQWEDVKPYGDSVLADVAVQALCEGYRLINNEINILVGRMYAAKNGVKRRIKEWPGLTNLRVDIGAPEAIRNGRTWAVPCRASWMLDGQQQQPLERMASDSGDFRILLPLHDSDSPALVRGKAESQLLRDIWRILTGSEIAVAEMIEPEELAGHLEETPNPINPVYFTRTPAEVSAEDERRGYTDDLIEECSADFQPMTDITGCNKIKLALEDEGKYPQDLIDACHQTRCDDIRSQRGESSNVTEDPADAQPEDPTAAERAVADIIRKLGGEFDAATEPPEVKRGVDVEELQAIHADFATCEAIDQLVSTYVAWTSKPASEVDLVLYLPWIEYRVAERYAELNQQTG